MSWQGGKLCLARFPWKGRKNSSALMMEGRKTKKVPEASEGFLNIKSPLIQLSDSGCWSGSCKGLALTPAHSFANTFQEKYRQQVFGGGHGKESWPVC